MSENILKSYEEGLTAGFEHNVLHYVEVEPDDDSPPDAPVEEEIVMFMMDFEYDPVRLTFDPDGAVSIHADEYKWHMFSADQLLFIAEKINEAEEMWNRIFDEIDEDEEA